MDGAIWPDGPYKPDGRLIVDGAFRPAPPDNDQSCRYRGHVAVHLIADDLDFDAWIADGLVRLEQLLANHAAFHQFPLRHYSDALDRLIEAIRSNDRLA